MESCLCFQSKSYPIRLPAAPIHSWKLGKVIAKNPIFRSTHGIWAAVLVLMPMSCHFQDAPLLYLFHRLFVSSLSQKLGLPHSFFIFILSSHSALFSITSYLHNKHVVVAASEPATTAFSLFTAYITFLLTSMPVSVSFSKDLSIFSNAYIHTQMPELTCSSFSPACSCENWTFKRQLLHEHVADFSFRHQDNWKGRNDFKTLCSSIFTGMLLVWRAQKPTNKKTEVPHTFYWHFKFFMMTWYMK